MTKEEIVVIDDAIDDITNVLEWGIGEKDDPNVLTLRVCKSKLNRLKNESQDSNLISFTTAEQVVMMMCLRYTYNKAEINDKKIKELIKQTLQKMTDSM